MNRRPIVVYLGGFASVGGIESFVRDLLVGLAPFYPERELAIWGLGQKGNRLLDDIARSGARVLGTFWRWGCAWRLPDYVLACFGQGPVRRAGAVLFKRLPPPPILARLRRLSRAGGREIPFVLIMPYRPLEYWGPTPNLRNLEPLDVIVVQSEEGRRDLANGGYPGRIECIPYLPPAITGLADFPARRRPGTIRLGFLGRLEAQKNVDYLLEIYRQLTARDGLPAFELHLFGEGSQRARLQRRSQELALRNVTFQGASPREEVPRAIDSCDLFLITSLTEGQCLVALEALSRGRPLVATPVGALTEILASPGLGRLAPQDDPAAFADAVAQLAKKIQDASITPGSVAAAFEEQFNREEILGQYVSLLASLGLPALDNGEAEPAATAGQPLLAPNHS